MQRFRGARAAAAVVLAVYTGLFLGTFHEADEDVWGRMAVGRLVLTSDAFPYEDVFAYVPTKPRWVDHEWLSGVVFYSVHRHFGGAGLLVLRALLGLGTVTLAFALGRRGGGAPAFTCAVSLATAILMLQGFNGVIRAQAFSFLLFALVWWLLETGGRRVWLIVPASALWANLHGGVVTGLGLVGVFALAGHGRRRLLVGVGVVATAATLLNPYGVHYWSYLAEALTMPRPYIVEWRSVALTPLLDDLHLKLAALLVGLALAARASAPRSVVLVGGTLMMSWLHVRFAPFLAITMVGTLPRAVEALFERGYAAFPKRWSPSLAPLASTVLVIALVAAGGAVAWRNRDLMPRMTVPPDRYPVSAIRYLAESGASGRLAVYFNWGEYALYHLHPRLLVSVDGRYETVYEDVVVQANWDFTHGVPGGERLLEQFPPDFALYPGGSGAARFLEESADWVATHRENPSVLYTKHHNR